ncbi:tyrosine-type recombinase/integrase [Siminovitchia fordii]|uniref:Tyrosine recombinase XerC n=1 Tax=Siminovitchia fordii TaxID=254759 RepID=A0ABQ4KA26_9BACI|nr:tyrosine-type recombinase/integrase [Siminovitchia fordii]GIN22579.1 tyrosine recombinase XerC [Siminovitchia fordii]
MLAEKVVMLNNSKVFNEIKRFLDNKYLISESNNTRNEYERDIRQFFYYLTDGKKDIEYLTIEDIQLSQDDIEDYQLYLVKLNKYANRTINRKLAPIKELYKRFERRKLVSDLSMFKDIKRLKETDKSYGVFSIEEVFKALDFVKNKPRSRKRLTKYHLIRFTIETRARLEECLSLEWNDFEVRGNDVVIHIVAKGNKDFKPRIAKWFYEELLEIKKENKKKVFDISKNSIQAMMNDIVEHLEVPEERNLTFHSWRKTGGTFIFNFTKDLEYTRKALNHSSISTTQKYIEGVDYGIYGMFSMQQNYDENLYKKVELTDLVKAIDKLDQAEKMRINMQLTKILN